MPYCMLVTDEQCNSSDRHNVDYYYYDPSEMLSMTNTFTIEFESKNEYMMALNVLKDLNLLTR